MKLRFATIVTSFGIGVAVLGAVLAASGLGTAQGLPQRISFQVGTGSTGGTYFPVGALIAGVISHPSGIDRCERADVCGPPGLILSARTSEGAVANVLAVNAGQIESGLAQSDVVAEAVAGNGVFRRAGKQGNIRIIADLFPEDLHLLVARKSHIAKITDLKGKRVSLGSETSGTFVTARAVLLAYGVSEASLKLRHTASDVDATAMQKGQLDAFFFEGGPPVPLVGDLLARGVARLVPIDGKGREKLVKTVPDLVPSVIAADTYPGVGDVQTVASRAMWVANRAVPDTLVYGIVKSLFNPANRALFEAGPAAASRIRLESATLDLPAPLHPGALLYYHQSASRMLPLKAQH